MPHAIASVTRLTLQKCAKYAASMQKDFNYALSALAVGVLGPNSHTCARAHPPVMRGSLAHGREPGVEAKLTLTPRSSARPDDLASKVTNETCRSSWADRESRISRGLRPREFQQGQEDE